MSNTIVTHVYKWIIDNVVENVRKDFSSMGVEESILQEFQRNWELKVINSKVANFQKFSVSNEDYYAHPTGYDPYNSTPSSELINQNNFSFPQFTNEQYSVPPNYNTVQAKIEPNINQINNQSSNIPQTDGANDELTTEDIDKIIEKKILEANNEKGKEIAQVDGEDDDDDDDDGNYDDDNNINSDLDDDDDDDNDDENETEHLILCQYEKVTRIKNKWKCSLKDGIINVNGKDYLFQKATGDFEW